GGWRRGAPSEASREAERRVRWDVAAALEDDLRVPPERDRAQRAVPRAAADPRADPLAAPGPVADEPRARERPAPHGEEVAERQPVPARDLEHARRLPRPHRVRAPA